VTLDTAAANYRHARFALDEAEQNQAIAHAAHVATMPLVGRLRLGNGSERTRKAHHAACEAAVTARRACEQARDELVAAALEHTGV
jgi:hypothetical protein